MFLIKDSCVFEWTPDTLRIFGNSIFQGQQIIDDCERMVHRIVDNHGVSDSVLRLLSRTPNQSKIGWWILAQSASEVEGRVVEVSFWGIIFLKKSFIQIHMSPLSKTHESFIKFINDSCEMQIMRFKIKLLICFSPPPSQGRQKFSRKAKSKGI